MTPADLDAAPDRPVEVVLALGGNLGDAAATLASGAEALRHHPGLLDVTVSAAVRTAPVGGPPGQPDYLNAVVLARTTLSPRMLLRACQHIEQQHHRRRGERWGPRTLDIDVIAVGQLVSDDPELTLPHPRAHQRAFVLLPWVSMDAGARLPGIAGGPVVELLAAAPDRDGVRQDRL